MKDSKQRATTKMEAAVARGDVIALSRLWKAYTTADKEPRHDNDTDSVSHPAPRTLIDACKQEDYESFWLIWNQFQCQSKLIQEIKKPDNDGNTALHIAARSPMPGILNAMLCLVDENDLPNILGMKNKMNKTIVDVASEPARYLIQTLLGQEHNVNQGDNPKVRKQFLPYNKPPQNAPCLDASNTSTPPCGVSVNSPHKRSRDQIRSEAQNPTKPKRRLKVS